MMVAAVVTFGRARPSHGFRIALRAATLHPWSPWPVPWSGSKCQAFALWAEVRSTRPAARRAIVSDSAPGLEDRIAHGLDGISARIVTLYRGTIGAALNPDNRIRAAGQADLAN